MIDRRHFAAMLAAGPAAALGATAISRAQLSKSESDFSYLSGVTSSERLIPPADRPIKVAFAINPGVQVIDLAGAWEVFQDTYTQESAFDLFTVSDTSSLVRATGGLQIVPDYTTATTPTPDVIVVPHFDQPSPFTGETTAIHDWIVSAHRTTLLTMSICTGAFQLAKTHLLDGVPATTNRRASDNFAKAFPAVKLIRGPRFVESGRIATSGGLSAGIDLALRVVSRFHGDAVAAQTANFMEYAGTGWRA